jgi:hypothetical protein
MSCEHVATREQDAKQIKQINLFSQITNDIIFKSMVIRNVKDTNNFKRLRKYKISKINVQWWNFI